MGVAFRVTLLPGMGQATAAFRPPPPRLPVFPTPTLGSNPFPASADHIVFLDVSRAEQAFSCRSPPANILLPREASNQKQNNGEEGREGKKSCARVACPSPALIPFDVQGVPPPGVRGRVGGRAERAPSGWPLPSAGRAREAVEVPQSPPGAPRSRCSPHPKPAQAAAPKCFLSALKQNPEGASFLSTSPRLALPAGRRLEEMNGPQPSWVRRTLPHPRCD